MAVVDIDVFKGLMDTKRIYAACASLREKSLDDATRAFLTHKLRVATREMRETIEYVEEQLGDGRAS